MKTLHKNTFALLLLFSLFATLPVFTVCASGIQEQEVKSIPTGSYVGNYIRNSENYTAIIQIEAGEIRSIRLKYNDSPLTDAWAEQQADLVREANSTRVKTVPSPSGRNKSVLKAIELALQAGLKMAE